MALLQRIESFDEFLAVKASHLDIVNLVERRIKAADVVTYFQQIVNIDDIFLAYLYEALVGIDQQLVISIALKADCVVAAGNDNLPGSGVMIILKQTDVADMDKAEVNAVDIKQQLLILFTLDTSFFHLVGQFVVATSIGV